MMNQKSKIIKFVFSFVVLGGAFCFLNFSEAKAQFFSLSPSTATKSAETEFSVDLNVDTEGKAISAADAKITFDSGVLQVTRVQKGTFFPEVTYNIYSGTLYVNGSFAESGKSASGSGKLATLVLKGKTAGTSPLTFVCSTQVSDANLLDTSGKDIIDCSSTKNGNYTILGSSTIGGGEVEEGETPTPEPPVSGVGWPTFLFLGFGFLLTILGLVFVF